MKKFQTVGIPMKVNWKNTTWYGTTGNIVGDILDSKFLGGLKETATATIVIVGYAMFQKFTRTMCTSLFVF